MANPVPPIPFKVPLTDDRSSLLSPAWAAWFRELFNRIGGTDASSNTVLDEDVADLQTQIDGLNQGRQL